MIRITVELLPHGSEDRKETLGTAFISNDGTGGNGTIGNYNVRLLKRGQKSGKPWKTGRVENFPRKQMLGWDLAYLALQATVGERHV